MKRKEYKDITELIADKLKAHKEPYKDGAWERFQQTSGSQGTPPWRWIAAAAAVLLVGSFFFIRLNQQNASRKAPSLAVVETPKVPGNVTESPVPDLGKETMTPMRNHPAGAEPSTAPGNIQPGKVRTTVQNQYALAAAEEANTSADKSAGEDLLTENQPASYADQGKTALANTTEPDPEPYTAAEKTQNGEVLAALSTARPIDPPLPVNPKGSAWSFGINVAPVMSEDNVNMGGGIEVSYQVAKNLSIRTGISYMELDAHKNIGQHSSAMMDAPAGPTALFSPSKTLNSVYTSVSGIDIPVNLEYRISDKFFASAGVSVFNVIRENRTHHFRTQVQELSYSKASNSSLAQTPQPVIKTVYSTEQAEQRPYEDHALTGFVNFSVGYKLPVLPRLNLSVEPFYKIPVKARSMQDMDLTNGGIRISAGF